MGAKGAASSETTPVSKNILKAGLVGAGCGVDLALCYPLWVAAKRLGAGLGWPRGREMYRGVLPVWASYFPALACDDLSCRYLQPALHRVSPVPCSKDVEQLVAATVAGAVAGIVVAAPTEGVVTRAHCLGISCSQTLLQALQTRRGLRSILLPYGQAAMVGREVPFSVGIFFLRDWLSNIFHRPVSQGSESQSQEVPGLSMRFCLNEVATASCSAFSINLVSHPPSVVLALQQAKNMPLKQALRQIYSNGGFRGFYVGFVARTVALTGSMAILPAFIRLEPKLESAIAKASLAEAESFESNNVPQLNF